VEYGKAKGKGNAQDDDVFALARSSFSRYFLVLVECWKHASLAPNLL